MQVAVIASSIATGLRIAAEVEGLPGVGLRIVVCNIGRRSPVRRWARELFLLIRSFRSLSADLLAYARSKRLIILERPLDDPASIVRVRSLQCDVGLHAANVIYREPIISAFRLGILNAHIGILPEYRGRSVAEWSVVQGDCTGVTVFFIDSGIDTGARIVLREYIPVNGAKNVSQLKNQLFACDACLYRKALEVLMTQGFQFANNETSEGQRYYVMSKMFTNVANEILGSRPT